MDQEENGRKSRVSGTIELCEIGLLSKRNRLSGEEEE